MSKLKKLATLLIEPSRAIDKTNAMITVYEDDKGHIVLGGIGWIERLEWEKDELPDV